MADLDMASSPSMPRTPDHRPATVLVVETWAVAAFGFAVGINQLGTQSPVDAILPVAIFSVGVVGILTAVRRSLLHRSEGARTGSRLGSPDPGIEVGFAHLALGLAALASVLWHWGVTAQGAVVGAYGVILGATAVLDTTVAVRARAAATTGADTPGTDWLAGVEVAVIAAQGVLLLVFAVAALADAGVQPFN